MKKSKKIKNLNINLFPESTSETEYKRAMAKFISEYETYIVSTIEYHSGGLFSSGYTTGETGGYKPDPDKGKLEWDRNYPDGYVTWKGNQKKLNAYGEQKLVDKINEIVDILNK